MSSIYSRYKRLSQDYDLPLPSPADAHPHRSLGSAWCSRRFTKRYLAILAVLLVCTYLRFWSVQNAASDSKSIVVDDQLPPLYEEWHTEELALPQHDPELPPPEGGEGRYINFANHIYGLGWGNALQEVLLDSYLAYQSGRAYVFDNYTWSRDLDPPPYSDYNGKLIPSRIPLRTMIVGPTAGGEFAHGDNSPRSVGVEYFRKVCPTPQIVSADEINAGIGVQDPTAQQVIARWLDVLNTIDNRCVEVDRFSQQVFGYWTFGSASRLLGIWEEYKKSPIVRQFKWSPLIHDAFDTNYRLFTSPSALGWSFLPFRSPDPYAPIPGLLVLHVRRGDYEAHCEHLANWSSEYSGFNDFPEFPDKFVPPPGSGTNGTATEEAKAIYREHCYPSIEQIVKRVEEIRDTKAGKGLKNVYVMTNGPRPWVADLKTALKQTGHWSKVATSRDMQLTPEQKYIAQAIDMLVGHRAQVIIGNGFSSMTSNIVMLRMARDDLTPDSNRFW